MICVNMYLNKFHSYTINTYYNDTKPLLKLFESEFE